MNRAGFGSVRQASRLIPTGSWTKLSRRSDKTARTPPSLAPEASSFDAMYEGTPPWDIGRPQPSLVRLAKSGAFEGAVLDAGCGTGENAMHLAGLGLKVVGLDGARRAIAQARAKARERGSTAEFVLGDALDLRALGRTFDRIVDCGLFHTFEDRERARYVREVAAVLRRGGRLFLLCFSELEPGEWGPRRVMQAEIRAAFGEGFSVESIAPDAFESRWGDAKAWLAAIRRA